MTDQMKKLKDLNKEKRRLEIVSDDHLKQFKNSFSEAKQETKSLLVNRVLIPAGIALVAGYGLKKFIDYLNSDSGTAEDYSGVDADPSTTPNVPPASSASSSRSGLLSGINWSSLAVQLVPFVVKVGQRLYEDGNLPYFKPPEEEEQ